MVKEKLIPVSFPPAVEKAVMAWAQAYREFRKRLPQKNVPELYLIGRAAQQQFPEPYKSRPIYQIDRRRLRNLLPRAVFEGVDAYMAAKDTMIHPKWETTDQLLEVLRYRKS